MRKLADHIDNQSAHFVLALDADSTCNVRHVEREVLRRRQFLDQPSGRAFERLEHQIQHFFLFSDHANGQCHAHMDTHSSKD